LGDVECLEHVVGGRQLHIDYRSETTSVEKADIAESGYSIGTVIMN
jgi:hypothetical protein